MKKKYVLVAMIVLTMGITACSYEPKEGGADAGTIAESKIIQEENAEKKPTNTEVADEETTNTEPVNTNSSEINEKENSDVEEIAQGDPVMGIVDRYEDNIIVIREMDDEDIILYFSTQNAQVVEGDSPIAAGDVVEITYKGVQGDEENPGIAVKVVAE